MDWSQVWTIIAAVAGLITLQSVWFTRSLDGLERNIGGRLDRIDTRLDRIEVTLGQHGEGVTRLEERSPAG